MIFQKENIEIQFNDDLMTRINELLSHYPEDKKKSALLPVLHAVQDAHHNWLSVGCMDKVAKILQIKPIEVYEVASFYTMYNLRPIGKTMFEFCQTSPCCLRDAEDLIEYTCQKLNIKKGETTTDGKFTVKGVECLGACGYAPMMQVGDIYYEHLTNEKIDELIEQYK